MRQTKQAKQLLFLLLFLAARFSLLASHVSLAAIETPLRAGHVWGLPSPNACRMSQHGSTCFYFWIWMCHRLLLPSPTCHSDSPTPAPSPAEFWQTLSPVGRAPIKFTLSCHISFMGKFCFRFIKRQTIFAIFLSDQPPSAPAPVPSPISAPPYSKFMLYAFCRSGWAYSPRRKACGLWGDVGCKVCSVRRRGGMGAVGRRLWKGRWGKEGGGAIKPKEIAASQSGSWERESLKSLLLPAATSYSVMLCLLFKYPHSACPSTIWSERELLEEEDIFVNSKM